MQPDSGSGCEPSRRHLLLKNNPAFLLFPAPFLHGSEITGGNMRKNTVDPALHQRAFTQARFLEMPGAVCNNSAAAITRTPPHETEKAAFP